MMSDETLYRRIAEGAASVAAALREEQRFSDAQLAADEIVEQLLILGDHYDELDKLPDWAELVCRRLCDAFGALDGYELSAIKMD